MTYLEEKQEIKDNAILRVCDYLETRNDLDLDKEYKSIKDMFEYVTFKAKELANSSSSIMVEDKEVYSWAVHYYDESDEVIAKEKGDKTQAQKEEEEKQRKEEIKQEKLKAEEDDKKSKEQLDMFDKAKTENDIETLKKMKTMKLIDVTLSKKIDEEIERIEKNKDPQQIRLF